MIRQLLIPNFGGSDEVLGLNEYWDYAWAGQLIKHS